MNSWPTVTAVVNVWDGKDPRRLMSSIPETMEKHVLNSDHKDGAPTSSLWSSHSAFDVCFFMLGALTATIMAMDSIFDIICEINRHQMPDNEFIALLLQPLNAGKTIVEIAFLHHRAGGKR